MENKTQTAMFLFQMRSFKMSSRICSLDVSGYYWKTLINFDSSSYERLCPLKECTSFLVTKNSSKVFELRYFHIVYGTSCGKHASTLRLEFRYTSNNCHSNIYNQQSGMGRWKLFWIILYDIHLLRKSKVLLDCSEGSVLSALVILSNVKSNWNSEYNRDNPCSGLSGLKNTGLLLFCSSRIGG